MADMSGMMQQQADPMQQQGGGQDLPGAPQAQPGMAPQGGPAAMSPQPDPSMGTYGADQMTPQDEQIKNHINAAIQESNLAKRLKKKEKGEYLKKMGMEIVKGYEDDEESRRPWMEQNKEWMELALLVRKNKTWPWPKASNIKYPLLAIAAMQFSARAYPALVPTDGNIVKTKVVSKDAGDQVFQAAENICQHMSYQVLERIPNWEEDMDKLLMTMAITGICFKKTYYNTVTQVPHSHIIFPENLCVNYWAKSLAKAYRKTEILYYTDNDIQEKVNNDEEFLDLDFSTATTEIQEQKRKPVVSDTAPPPSGKSTPHVFLACHTFWDMDEDGYEEPVIITVHKATKQVVRVVARWSLDGVHRDEKGKIIQIDPYEYYTDFPFIPNPDGSVYALGFGTLLGPLNESSNTIINQLVDAGTLANMPSGFIGKGLRLKIGQTQLQPGEFKVVNATGQDLQQSVYQFPFKEPSGVLFNLLNMLIQSGKELASIAEIFVGKMPGQNTPATTTQETVQQGMAVFTAIYKRVYRSLAKEFRKLYQLNKYNPDCVSQDAQDSGIMVSPTDYDLPEWTIIPGADPSGDSQTTKMAKLQQVGQLLQMGTIDPMVYTRMMLDGLEIPNGQQLIKQPEPPAPDPSVQTEQMKQQTEQIKQQGMQQKQAGEQQKMQAEIALKQREADLEEKRFQQQQQHEMVMNAIKEHGKRMEQHTKMVTDHMNAMTTHALNSQKIRHNEIQGQQKIRQTAQQGQQKLHLNKQAFAQQQDQKKQQAEQAMAQQAESSAE